MLKRKSLEISKPDICFMKLDKGKLNNLEECRRKEIIKT